VVAAEVATEQVLEEATLPVWSKGDVLASPLISAI